MSDNYLSGVLGRMLLLGLAVGCCLMPTNVAVLTGVAPRGSGAASGVLQTMMQLGGALDLAILVTRWQRRRCGRRPGLPGCRRRGPGFVQAAPLVPHWEKTINRSHARIRALGERAITAVKCWKLLATLSCCPNGSPRYSPRSSSSTP